MEQLKRSASASAATTLGRTHTQGSTNLCDLSHFRCATKMDIGEGNNTIAAYLTDTLGNGRYLSFRVPRLLANRVYLGEARSGAGIANSGAHEPLVDERTF